MNERAEHDERRSQPPMLLGDRRDDQTGSPVDPGDRPRIESDGRYAKPNEEPPPDPRAVIEDLRRKLRAEREKSLNATDAVLGARAAAAQAKAETQEIYYRLHVRETELAQLKELMAAQADEERDAAQGEDHLKNRVEQILGRPVRPAGRSGDSGGAGQQSIAANASSTARGVIAAAKRFVGE